MHGCVNAQTNGGVDACMDALDTANLITKILDFIGFESSIILTLRGGILMSIGISPEVLSQGILAGMILAGRLGMQGCVQESDSSGASMQWWEATEALGACTKWMQWTQWMRWIQSM